MSATRENHLNIPLPKFSNNFFSLKKKMQTVFRRIVVLDHLVQNILGYFLASSENLCKIHTFVLLSKKVHTIAIIPHFVLIACVTFAFPAFVSIHEFCSFDPSNSHQDLAGAGSKQGAA